MIIVILLFIIGLCIGSFVNAFEYRIEKDKTISGRSFCPNCEHKLSWNDLIPIISWVTLSGKCRYCKKHISLQYPIVEFITGLAFVGVGVTSGLATEINNFISRGSIGDSSVFISLVVLLVVSSLLILIALHDYKTGYILSSYVYLAIIAAIAYNVFAGNVTNMDTFFPYLLSAAIPAAFFFALYKVSNEKWMGEGDYEIALLMGFLLGWPQTLVAHYFAFIVGSIVGLFQIYVLKTQDKKGTIPFAPFLIAGTFFCFLFWRANIFFLC